MILNWEKFKPLMGDWDKLIYPFFQRGGMDKIYTELKAISKRGKKILPESDKVFRAFYECPYNKLKLVIVGMSPYHTMKNREIPIADGLALSCGITNYPQPSLDKFWDAIERELYRDLCIPCIKNPDLTYLANSGVLLLNAGLTCEYLKAGSHNQLWEPFMKFLFQEVLDTAGVPVLLLGKEAQKLEKYINPFTTILKTSHPASAAYNNEEWDSEGVFKQINTILKYRNNDTVDWFVIDKSEENEEDELPF